MRRSDARNVQPERPIKRVAIIPSGAGEPYRWFGHLATIRLESSETAGELAIVELIAPHSLEIPLHLHRDEDETLVLLEGFATFRIGQTIVTAGPGDVIFAPRNVAHGYIVGSEELRMLTLFTPGGFEDFIRQTGERARLTFDQALKEVVRKDS